MNKKFHWPAIFVTGRWDLKHELSAGVSVVALKGRPESDGAETCCRNWPRCCQKEAHTSSVRRPRYGTRQVPLRDRSEESGTHASRNGVFLAIARHGYSRHEAFFGGCKDRFAYRP